MNPIVSDSKDDPVRILLVDDQPAKLLSYEVILSDLGETLVKAGSAREALKHLLDQEVAVILLDVSMPEMDGFELAKMIREHPRFRQTAIIFVSAIQVTELDSLRGYQAGAVDYVPVPVVAEVLRAKVKIFVELYRKTRELQRLNEELERRVADRTAELEAAALRLRESEQRRTVALAAGQMGAWDWDLATGAVTWDAGQYRIFGRELDNGPVDFEMVRPLIHPSDIDRVGRAMLKAIRRVGHYQTEVRILRGGDVAWCICAAAATVKPDGIVTRISGVTIDITERKQAEEALRQLNQDLEQRIEERTREREMALAQLFEAQKVDSIGQLTGGIAHDFNNLLMAILGSLELLKKRLPIDDERASRLLGNAIQGAERGKSLTQRLLAFARRQELKPEAIDIATLIEGMEDLIERALEPGISITKNLPAGLPLARADANQLELAILNLVVNARDAMSGGGEISIGATAESIWPNCDNQPSDLPTGDYVRIEVSDSGAGMDAQTLARATEPFFTTKGPGKGTGLGLPMVQGLAVQSGGTMVVRSEIGKGTSVYLWLPEAEGLDRSAADDEAQSSSDIYVQRPRSDLTVLVVDDDALVRTGTAAMLEDLGYRVVEANSGLGALAALRDPASSIGIVITDYAMPGMTGLELIRQIRGIQPSLVTILASGYAEIAQEQYSLLRLSKPFRQSELEAAIHDALRSPFLPGESGEQPTFDRVSV